MVYCFGILFQLFFKIFNMSPISLKLQASWDEVKERMKENDLRLTDADLVYDPGHEEELLLRLEKIMNKTRPEVIAYIESISGNTGLSG